MFSVAETLPRLLVLKQSWAALATALSRTPSARSAMALRTTMLLIDFGLGAILVLLAIFMGWRLIDLFAKDGVWSNEFDAEKKANAKADIEEQKRKLAELQATLDEVSK